jgi:ATP-dependent Clp protease ATP-binding subunit ClpA
MFLDEFEKTTEDVHKALLVPFDNGRYRNGTLPEFVWRTE